MLGSTGTLRNKMNDVTCVLRLGGIDRRAEVVSRIYLRIYLRIGSPVSAMRFWISATVHPVR